MKKALIILLTLMLLCSTATAATLTVPTQYKSIKEAVNAAHNGDTIYVKSGTYKELVTVNDKSLSFQGEKIKNTYKYPKVYGFETNTQFGSIDSINGFTIIRDGVYLGECGGCTIRNNYFTNCGVCLIGQTVSDNIVMNNKFSGNYNYYGVIMRESYDNIIIGNTFTKADNGIYFSWGSSCKKISGNTFSGCKIAFHCDYIPSCLIGNTYSKNKVNVKVDEALAS